MPNKRKATIDDISLRIAKDGRVQVLVSEDVAKAVVAKNDVNAYVHGFMASNKLDMLEAIFTGESPSVMSTTERFQHGIFITGMSSGDDHGKDSADNLFFTLYKSKSSKGDGSAVVDPVAMHRHTDYYFREGDRFGARESDQLNWLNKPVDGGEMMIQRRFEMDLFSYVVLSEPGRTDLIKKLHGRGITTAPNGKPLEDFLVTSPPSFYSVDFGDEVPLGSLPDDGTPIAGAPSVMAGV